MQILNKFRQLDAYPKINEDFYSRTLAGGVITIVTSIAIIILFFSELRLYLQPRILNQLVVDTSRGETLQINLDITFPSLACSVISLDAMDISGEQHLDVKHNIFKKRLKEGAVVEVKPDVVNVPKLEKPLQRHGGRLEHNETYCGSCFGAETSSLTWKSKDCEPLCSGIHGGVVHKIADGQRDDQCCNSCEEVREAYRDKGWALTNVELIDQCKREGFLERIKEEEGEGCQLYGSLEVNKVAGNFHFAPGKSFQHSNIHVHDIQTFGKDSFNLSHHINELTFGAHFPGISNPLDRVGQTQEMPAVMFQYFLKVVPTSYTDARGHKISSNQYSVTEYAKKVSPGQRGALPGVFFFYELSPIKVEFTESRTSFLHFLTNVCAIVGGVFTVAGIIDALVYHGQKAIKKKIEIGKLS